jgi:hypothetical protein
MNVRVNAMPLTPFVPVDYPWDETGVIRVSLPGQQQFSQGKFLTPPYFSVFTHEIPKDPSVSIFTIDMAFVRNLLRATPSYEAFAARVAEHSRVFHKEWGRQLKVINNTDLVAEAYLLGVKGERRFSQIEPRQTWQIAVEPRQLWQFRSPFSGEIIGMVVVTTREGEGFSSVIETVTLTDEFRQAREAYQARSGAASPKPSFAPLRLIGERRKSTPGLDDQMFLTATVVRQDFSKETFNGLPNRVLRDVEIAGPL